MTLLLSLPSGSGFLLIICAFIYFVPSIVAQRRKKRDITPILLVNIFLGWTLIGWVVALIWAVSSDKKITDREKMLQLQEDNNRLLNEIANQDKVSQINFKNVKSDVPEDLLEKALNTLEINPDYEYMEKYNSTFTKKRPFYKNAGFLAILAIVLVAILMSYLQTVYTTNNQSNLATTINDVTEKSDFDISFKNLDFNYSNGHVNFGCKLIMKNNTNHSFSNLIFSEKNLRIEYPDNTVDQYDMFMMGKWKFKPGSINKIDMAISPFTNSRPYITLEDLQRTPAKAVMKCIFNAISLDKEIPESFEVDVLPEWIELQKQKGIR